MTTRQNYLMHDAEFPIALTLGLSLVGQLVTRDPTLSDWVFLVSSRGFMQGSSTSALLGPKRTKALLDGEAFTNLGARFRLETARTLRPSMPVRAVIAVAPTQAMMDQVDSLHGVTAVIAVPLAVADIEEWQRAWQPQFLGAAAPTAPAPALIPDAVVEAALQSLTTRINLSNRVLSSTDAEAVFDAFRILRAHGHSPDPKAIRTWCVGHGWDPRGADEAQKFATKAFGAKTKPRNYGTAWASDIYTRWVAAKARGP